MRWATWSRALAALPILLALAACGPPPPSVLVVTLDTLRRDHVGAYGGQGGLTPELDALAADGLVHEHAYTTMPTTGPAHVSLFTGLPPALHGSRRNGEPLKPELAGRDVAAQLQRAGWATAAFVTSSPAGLRATGLRGFEIYDEPRGVLRHGEAAVNDALAWLAAEKRRPVLLWVHLYDAHSPYGSADDKRRSFPMPQGRYGWLDTDHYADARVRAATRLRYEAGVRSADAALGALVRGAREILETPPLIVIASDHGEALDEYLEERRWGFDHGEFLDPESVTIPCVVAGPGVTPGRSTATVSIRDLYGTILAAAGLPDPDAAAEGRRDLRRAGAEDRAVGIERRRFRSRVDPLVRQHRGAAASGERLVIVGADGSLTSGPADAAELTALARSLAAAAGDGAPALPPETRDALRALGYAE